MQIKMRYYCTPIRMLKVLKVTDNIKCQWGFRGTGTLTVLKKVSVCIITILVHTHVHCSTAHNNQDMKAT